MTNYLSADEQEYGIALLLSCLVGASFKSGLQRAGLKPSGIEQKKHVLFTDPTMIVQQSQQFRSSGDQPWLQICADVVMSATDEDQIVLD